uniref:Cation efflux protein cytoplasmic domain-containing protein n=1 Tax=Acrobeloides nanus TaxID=290746 RepID=A0A914DG22_9BILA
MGKKNKKRNEKLVNSSQNYNKNDHMANNKEPSLINGNDLYLPDPKPCNDNHLPLIGKCSNQKVKEYYERQNNLLESYKADSEKVQNSESKKRKSLKSKNNIKRRNSKVIEKVDEVKIHKQLDSYRDACQNIYFKSPEYILSTPGSRKSEEAKEIDETGSAARKLAFITLLVNITLTLAKCVASYLSGSLSIISSLVDSLVDITSGVVIWLTSRAIKNRDPYTYPRGRTRLEPLALIIVSVIMSVASIQMIVQSLESIISETVDPTIELPTLLIMISTILTKMALVVVCKRFQDDPSIQVLAQDHRNDCISNFVALLCAYGAQHLWIYLDPIGAILVSIYIACTWFLTGKEHLAMLSGKSADPDFINRIIKMCLEHDDRIDFLDTVYVYHYGTKFLVEVHIVLDQEMKLKDSHDIAESLQTNIESLPEVERAFVHCDYEYEHLPEDEHKVV